MKCPEGKKIVWGGHKFYPGDEIPDEIAKQMGLVDAGKPAPVPAPGKK